MATDVIIDPSTGQIYWNDSAGVGTESISIKGDAVNTISFTGYSGSFSPGSTPAGALTLVTIKDSAGTDALIPGTTGYNLGSSTLRWNTFASNANLSGTLVVSDSTISSSLLTGSTRINGGIAISGNASIGQSLNFYNTAATFYTGFRAGATSANTLYTLPTAFPGSASFLQSDASGTLTWVGSIGTATTATNVNVVSASTSASHPVLFTPATGTASGAAVSTESSFVYNPSTDILSVSGLAITSGTASTNTTTGALVVRGGLGVTGQLSFARASFGFTGITTNPTMSFIGATSSSPITLTVLTDNSLNFEGSQGSVFSIDSNLSTGEIFSVSDISGLPIISASAGQTVTFNEFGGFTRIGNGSINSSSTTTGSLFVSGGLGITGNAFIGGTASITSNQVSISPSSGALVVTGGVGIGQTLNVGNELKVQGTSASTSTTTGALVVSGGVGIGGSVSVAGRVGIGTIPSAGMLSIRTSAAGTTGISILASGSQTANMIEFVNSTNTYMSWITNDGTFAHGAYFTHNDGRIPGVSVQRSNGAGIVARGYNSDTSPAIEVQNNPGSLMVGLYPGGLVYGGVLQAWASTASTNTTTGALIVAGGAAIAGTTNFGRDVRIFSSLASLSPFTGSLVVSGGVGISNNLFVGGGVAFTSVTASTSTNTGTLVVSGGVGIGGSLYVASATAISGVTINAGVITGTLSGYATTARNTDVSVASTNATHYITFTTASSGSGLGQSADNDLTYNPSTNLLTSGTFSGNLSATATTTGLANVTNTSASTSTTTGALVVTGGVGIGRTINIGGRATIGSTDFGASLSLAAPSTGLKSLVIRKLASQSANTFEIQDADGNALISTSFNAGSGQTGSGVFNIHANREVGDASSETVFAVKNSSTDVFRIGRNGVLGFTGTLSASDGLGTYETIFSNVYGSRVDWQKLIWFYGSGLDFKTAGSQLVNASSQLKITNSGTSSVSGVMVIANGWGEGGAARVFGIGTPAASERSYFKGYGNLVINPNNPNGLHAAWNTMDLISLDISGTATTYSGNIIKGSVEGTERFSVGPFGNTRITVGTATTATGFIVKAVASQTGNLIETQSSAGATNFYITPAGNVKVSSTTPSTSSSTGALVVSGGVGIGQTLNVGNELKVQGTSASTSTTTGALVVSGGVGIAQTAFIGGNVNILGSTASTSTTTGALVVTGGVGIGGSLFTAPTSKSSISGVSFKDSRAENGFQINATGSYTFNITDSSNNQRLNYHSDSNRTEFTGNNATHEIRLIHSNNSGYTGLKSNSSGTVTYTFPAGDGSNGQALTTNGSATLSWTTITGGSGGGGTGVQPGGQYEIAYYTATGASVNGSPTFKNDTAAAKVTITHTTASTSTTTGALVISGGVGIGGSLYTSTGSSSSVSGVTLANGNVSATTYNKLTLTAPASSATLTLANGSSLITSGGHSLTFNTTATTSVTLPTTGTLATTSNKLSDFAATTSLELFNTITGETGSGALVFATSPDFTTSVTTPSTTFSVFNATATTINAFGAATVMSIGAATGKATFNSTDNSISSTTGGLVVSGGAGIAKSVSVGGYLQLFNGANYTSFVSSASGNTVYTLPATSPATGSSVLQSTSAGVMSWVPMVASSSGAGSGTVAIPGAQYQVAAYYSGTGASVSGSTTFTNNTSTGVVAITHNTASTSTGTGALVISGGLGIAGNAFIGGTINVPSTSTSNVSNILFTNGTISSGTWAGTVITSLYGGTGFNSYTIGDILVASTGTSLAKLPAGSTNFVLTSNGTGTVPSWQAVPSSAASSVAVTPTTLNQSFFITAVSSSNGSGLGISTITTLVINPSTGIVTASGLAVTSGLNASTTTSAAFTVLGGLGITGNAFIGGTASVTSTQVSISSSSGALVVTGGVGIGGTLFTSAGSTSSVSGVLLQNGNVSASTYNKLTLTAPATSATLTLAQGSTLATSGANSLTFTTTAASNVTFPTAGTLTTQGNKLSVFALTSGTELAGVISDKTGTGNLVFASSPSLTTPTLGVASATTINKVTITAPTTSATLTLVDGSTLTTAGAFGLTLTTTAASNVTFPTAGTLLTSGATSPNFLTSVTTSSGTFALFNTTATTINAFGAATVMSIGAATGKATFNSTDDSSSTTTGSLAVSGGAGFAKSVSVGGRLQMFNGANFTAFVSSASGNTVYTLPATSPATGSSVLQSTSTGVMSWVPMTAGGGPSGTINSSTVNNIAYYSAATTLSGDSVASGNYFFYSGTNTGLNIAHADNEYSPTASTKLLTVGTGATNYSTYRKALAVISTNNAWTNGDLLVLGVGALGSDVRFGVDWTGRVQIGTPGTGFTLPSTNGTSGQVLTANTDGKATWTTVAGGGSGSVNSGTAGSVAFYAADGTAVSGTGLIQVITSGTAISVNTNLDLRTQNDIRFFNSGNTFFTALQASNNSANYTLSLPTAPVGAGFSVIVTDNNGQMYFSAPGPGIAFSSATANTPLIRAKKPINLQFSAGFTPLAAGPDNAILRIPESPSDGTTVITYNLRRFQVRVETPSAGTSRLQLERSSTDTGAFTLAASGSSHIGGFGVTITGAGIYLTSVTSFAGSLVTSGNLLRLNWTLLNATHANFMVNLLLEEV